MNNSVSISLNFGAQSYTVGELSSRSGRSILNIKSLPFPIPGMGVGITYFPDNTPPFWIRDALPDAWGERVMLHEMEKAGLKSSEITLALRLSYVGNSGLGAWQFLPERHFSSGEFVRDIEWIREQATKLLKHEPSVNLDWMVGSISLGGARPKLFVDLDGNQISLERIAKERDWLVKLPGVNDAPDDGQWEYMYAKIAKAYGLHIPEYALIHGKYFASKRFDKIGHKRWIVRTLSGINQKPHQDNMGNNYESAMDTLPDMSFDRINQYLKLVVFNSVMINRDDHAKNISYLIDAHGRMTDAPFYDLTYAPSLGGHGISLNRESWFGIEDILEIFQIYGLSKKQIILAITELKDTIAPWQRWVQESGIEDTYRLHERHSEILSELKKIG